MSASSGPFPNHDRVPHTLWQIVRSALAKWLTEDVMHWGAALAYYTLFSLGPLLAFLAGTLGMLFDASTAQAEILIQLRLILGQRGAGIAETLLREASFPGFGSLASLGSLALLLVGATAVFSNVQGALNEIWNVRAVTGTVRNALRTRGTAFLMILVVGGLILVSFLASAATSVLEPFIERRLLWGGGVVRAMDFGLSTVVLWGAFAAVYRVLPDARVSWRDVWVGALATAILFVVGKMLMGAFLSRNQLGSAFGAAGSMFVLMVWVYYSSQVLLIGAAFTEAWARSHGRAIEPNDYAGRVIERIAEGAPD